ncbi:hypothetical protein BT96DRAFT_336234 [Gymnopus androsaceus JB14]|uniref:Uncharacterized protein n=1 Tax=Gymnopus androsaceus JB14 TaxID=1447944 RepID=A0A6A4I8G3_9AGAR|nr:hypothetical protein BT96DRAFT_336234 [Gymnopus androsaceus JB14]
MVRFPRRRAFNDPPPPRNEEVNGRRTPLYGLAWVCTPEQLARSLEAPVRAFGGAYRGRLVKKWDPENRFSYSLAPCVDLGEDMNYYVIALWNLPHPGHKADDIIDAARKALDVDSDPDLESTFMWYRFPLAWLRKEERERERLQYQAA